MENVSLFEVEWNCDVIIILARMTVLYSIITGYDRHESVDTIPVISLLTRSVTSHATPEMLLFIFHSSSICNKYTKTSTCRLKLLPFIFQQSALSGTLPEPGAIKRACEMR